MSVEANTDMRSSTPCLVPHLTLPAHRGANVALTQLGYPGHRNNSASRFSLNKSVSLQVAYAIFPLACVYNS